jgi:hypothetical protein
MTTPTVTAFRGQARLASGALRDVARVAWQAITHGDPATGPVLVFDDATARVIDLEMRGDERAMLAHLEATMPAHMTPSPAEEAEHVPTTPRTRGRPRLGVVAREVTLLPRHWEWLAAQPGGASVALRKLVDCARRDPTDDDRARAARDVAYRFMHAMAGDLPNFEEAVRALYRGDEARLRALIATWPPDIATYSAQLAFPGS